MLEYKFSKTTIGHYDFTVSATGNKEVIWRDARSHGARGDKYMVYRQGRYSQISNTLMNYEGC